MRYLLSGLILSIACCGFGSDIHLRSIAPDRQSEIRIYWAHGGADVAVKIVAHTSAGDQVLFKPDGDRIPGLEEVVWSKDASRVAILNCDSLNRRILLAYDVQQKRALPTETMIDDLKQVLIRRYELASDTLAHFDQDPIRWACSADGYKEFHRLV